MAVHVGNRAGLDGRGQGCCNQIVRAVGRDDVPDADQLPVLDGHDIADVADELLAAGAVMLRPLTVDRVGAIGEGCQVGGPEVITGDGSNE